MRGTVMPAAVSSRAASSDTTIVYVLDVCVTHEHRPVHAVHVVELTTRRSVVTLASAR